MSNHPNRSKKYWISEGLAVDRDTAVELADNGETGDQCVTLYRATCTAGHLKGSEIYYLGTNGDPCLITESNIAEAAEDIGMSQLKFCELIDPDRTWAFPADVD